LSDKMEGSFISPAKVKGNTIKGSQRFRAIFRSRELNNLSGNSFMQMISRVYKIRDVKILISGRS
jgi:hypothetical protein